MSGLVFFALGLWFAVSSFGYELGSPLDMGPGAFPLGTAVLLMGLGVAVIVKAWVAPSRRETLLEEPASGEDVAGGSTLDALVEAKASQVAPGLLMTQPTPVATGQNREDPLPFGRIPWRPLLIVLSAIVFFALTVDGLGLIATAFVSVAAVSFARKETTWKQALLTSAALTALSWVVFSVLLQLNVSVLGSWIGG